MSARLLDGLRVLDLTSVVVGPAATLRLADYGAEIIKVEPPEGDLMRVMGGPSHSRELSPKFMHFNRGKRFVCLDLKQPAALAALRKILAGCDVLISNMRPKALEKLGLDAAACRAKNPALVHCLITGFGPGGPYRGRPAYDTVLQGVSGVAGLSAMRDGAPAYAPFLAVDHVVAEITAGAVLAALVRRARTGEGASLEIPMHETMAAFVMKEHLGAASFSPPLGPPGDKRIIDPHNRPSRTRDGWISITANSDAQARGFLRVIGRADLIDDPRFRTAAARYDNAGDWFALRAALEANTSSHWLAAFEAADVPAMPCHTLDTLRDDPQLRAVALTREVTHPVEGAMTQVRGSVLVDGAPAPSEALAGLRGTDTVAVLREFGVANDEIDALVASGAARS
jgi:crotonobetainyl-CoA:carnitine CoA-transferase CaiB-like acyl-CoA transferase